MRTRAAILGPTGYTGYFLIQLLLRHPQAQLTYLASHRPELPDVAKEFPQLVGRLDGIPVGPIDPHAISKVADVIFLCVPHVAAMKYAPMLLDAGLRVIDLSADYRLRDAKQYEDVYQHAHADTKNLEHAVYGLPEFFSEQIKTARLVANPGCYPTAAVLGIAPLLKAHGMVREKGIVVNAASGVTGAGRDPKPNLHFPEVNEGFVAYNPGVHRHQPEISQTLSTVVGRPQHVLFVPHLLPIDRGILATIYMDPAGPHVKDEHLLFALEQTYKGQPFVRVRHDLPNVKHVRDTNFCDVTARLLGPPEARKVVAFSAIDNMIKGASGQAVQNMNLMYGHDQTAGLL